MENKFVIEVPAGVRYLGEWNDFKFNRFPAKCIINKQLPGCGFTEYSILGDEFVILASPRIMLINNKADQHSDVFLVKNEMDKDPGIDKDLNKSPKEGSKSAEKVMSEEEIEEKNSIIFNRIKNELKLYLDNCRIRCKAPKILVTYDSYHIVKDILSSDEFGDIFKRFYTVVDEFQSILHDSRFKSDTEMQFLNNLKSSHSALFVSATPMMDDYLNMLDEFDGLPYFQLDWGKNDPTRIIKPNLDIYLMRSVNEKAGQVIKTYLDGNFESVTVLKDGKPVTVTSTEAVLYVNSVNHIISIIKRMNLSPSQVLILCSNTDENQKRIWSKLGRGFNIGHVPNPNKGEKFPMFTFCTRTVYLGADFYSTCARTFIFSDANIDSLSVDISEDLPQILGRQRLNENPWKNSATFYYRTTADYRKMKKEDFDNKLEKKKKKTENLLKAYRSATDNSVKCDLAEAYQNLAKLLNYKNNYVAVNKIYNPVAKKMILKPVINKLVYINELRAFNIQQIDYKDRFTVFSTVNNQFTPDDIINHEVAGFLMVYNAKTTRYDKLKLLSEYDMSDKAREIILGQISDDDEVKSYYLVLGPDRLKELGYSVTLIKKELKIVTFDEGKLKEEIYNNFNVGDKLPLSDIKTKLQTIYTKVNYDKTPKAIDLNNYFETKESTMRTIIDGVKKTVRYYELLSKK